MTSGGAPGASLRRERLGILGGTFDPVHVAHIVAAMDAREALDLDRVLFVVAGDPWQKSGQVRAPARARLAMVRAAVEGVEGIEASGIEVERSGPTYTADTLEALARPERDLFLVVGSDVAASLATWKRVDVVRSLTTVVVVERSGQPAVSPPGEGWRVEYVTIPRFDISSTDVRDRVAAGRPIDFLVPRGAVRILREEGLYTRPDGQGA